MQKTHDPLPFLISFKWIIFRKYPVFLGNVKSKNSIQNTPPSLDCDGSVHRKAHILNIFVLNISKKASTIEMVRIDPHGSSYKCILSFKMRVKDPSILLFDSPLSRKISRPSQSNLETTRENFRVDPRRVTSCGKFDFLRMSPDLLLGCYFEETTPRLAHFNLAFFRHPRGRE